MKYSVAWLMASLFACVCPGVCLGQQARLGLMPDGRVMLATGWKIKPAGEQVAVDTLPMSSAVSSDGKFLLVLNGGIHAPSISVISTASEHELGRTPLPDAWLGLRMAPAGNLVYVGGGSTGKVYELALGTDGTLSRSREFAIADSKNAGAPFIGDVALSPDGRVLYAADLYGDNIAQVNLQSGKMVDHWHTGRRPYRIAVSPDGAHLLVSSWADGALYEHESGTGILVTKVRVGAHPTDMLWVNKPVSSGESGGSYVGRIFVAVGNSNGVAELGVTQDGQFTSIESINTGLTPMNPLGMTPSALASNAAGTRLYVACSGANAIAVADISQPPARMLGYVPSGWYPTSVGLLKDNQLVITNGNGSGEAAKRGENLAGALKTVADAPGTVEFVSAGQQADLHALSETVTDNSPYRDELIYGPISDPKEAFFLKLENHPSPLQHVIYLIKGNQSYDAVLGDLPKGNGDKSLARFGRVTPNLHELASQFVTYDNFYANGQAMADGQNWAVGAIAPDYTVRLWPSAYAGRSQVFDFESADLSNTPPAGYLWSNAVAAGVTVRNYGEWVTNVSPAAVDGAPQVKAVSDASLAAYTDQNFRGFDPAFKDTNRAQEFIREWKAEDDKGALPQLSIVRLGNDGSEPNHSAGAAQGTDAAHVADNDAAVGALVEAVSRSKAWSSTVIFVVESSGGGADHVNGYRTPAWIVSPYTRQGSVDSSLYNQMSVLTTLEILLGLRPMTHFDAGARPMFGGFSQQANPAPFQAVPAGGR